MKIKNQLSLIFLILLISYKVISQDTETVTQGSTFQIPKENIEEGKILSLENASSTATLIIKAITKEDMNLAKKAFFPEEAFLNLKDIKWPGVYYKKLIKWYMDDIKKESQRFKGKTTLKLEKFLPGRCRWKKVGSEYNKIAYWSCYRNKFIVSDGKNEYPIELRAMINWGKRWFVTHLGPIPQE